MKRIRPNVQGITINLPGGERRTFPALSPVGALPEGTIADLEAAGLVVGYSDDEEALHAEKLDFPIESAAERITRLSAEVRAKRDALLLESDTWMRAAIDWPIPADITRTAWTAAVKAYRQTLRDIPTQAGFPESIAWPELPPGVKSKVEG